MVLLFVVLVAAGALSCSVCAATFFLVHKAEIRFRGKNLAGDN